ncbi:GNVR domain-containing protein [Bordetella bronchialis]|uniref:GNVR domain-containing protein n=1 Tax=Bordetella bronchialis TaxID=463025 RepID=UPI003CFD2127
MASSQADRFLLPSDQERGLTDYVELVLSNKALIAGVAAIVFLLGGLYLLVVSPTYESDLVIQVEDQSNQSGSLLGDLSSVLRLKEGSAAEMQIIKSRLVLSAAVDKLRLYLDARPVMFPIVGRWLQQRPSVGAPLADPRFGLGSYAWGGESIELLKFDVPHRLENKRFVLTTLVGDRYRLTDESGEFDLQGSVGVPLDASRDGDSLHLLVSSLVARPGQRFELWRRSRLDIVDALQRQIKVQELGRESDVIGVTLTGSDPARTAQVLNAIAEEYLIQNLAYHRLETHKTLEFLNGQLPRLKQELERAETAFNAFRNRNGTIDLGQQTRLLLEQSVDAQTKLLELRTRRGDLAQRFTSESPAIQALDKQIGVLQRQVDEFTGKVATLPALEQQQVSLVRDLQVDTSLYMNLLNASQQLQIADAGKIGNVRVVDYAVPSERPVKPKQPLVMVFALAAGLALGVMVAVAKGVLFDVLHDPGSIEDAVGLPVLAQIPRSVRQMALDRQGEAPAVLVRRSPTEAASESLRSLQVALRFALPEEKRGVIMITGPSPVVGKSFVSMNLAMLFASPARDVLLIDCDLRRGCLHKAWGRPKAPGLAEYLRGHAEAERIVQAGDESTPDFISCGEYAEAPAHLLLSDRFGALLDALRARYRFIFLDTPPILAVADSAIVGRFADTTLVVAREGSTFLGELEHSIAALRQGGISPRGIVYNDMRAKSGRYGYYRRRYVGYYAYGEDK